MTTGLMRDTGEERVEEGQNGMQGLLDQTRDYKALRRGDIIDGVVMRVDKDGVLVDIGSKTEGVIPAREMQSLEADSSMKVGDEIIVYVMNPENQEGQVLLSLDRALGERGWRHLQRYLENGESLLANVSGYNKGGLLVNVEGVNGFVPASQLVGGRPEATPGEDGLARRVGEELRLKVIELNRRRNRAILSERAALQEWRSQQRERIFQQIIEGEIRHGKVASICDFGVFVDLGGVDGLVHLSELSWDRVKDPNDIVNLGDEVEVYVMKVDPQTQRVGLSLRRARSQDWDGIIDKYEVGQVVSGTITKVASFGAFARIEGPVEGLIHISELADHRVAHPKEVVKEGDVCTLKIIRIERERQRLGLSLRQANEEQGLS